MSRIKLQPAFVLHTRPFRDTSLLVDLLTMNYGRIHAVARSARGPKSRYKGVIRPFVPLLISWSGHADLVSLGNIELIHGSYELAGDSLLSGFYLNELLVRLLHFNDSHPRIYEAYENALIALQKQENTEITLRLFEKTLLLALGYGMQLNREAISGDTIDPDATYEFDVELGFIRKYSGKLTQTSNTFLGKHLLAFYNEIFTDSATLKTAKRLMRLALAPLLGDKPIKSRELFASTN